jgi:hypothetical protein
MASDSRLTSDIRDLVRGLRMAQAPVVGPAIMAAPGALLPYKHAVDHGSLLRASLQAAVRLELLTIPPYLCALWSIKNEMDPVALSIREVVQEEMFHLAMVCNMLAALGEVPDLVGAVPVYPSDPSDMLPSIVLSGLSKSSLRLFMEVERPRVVIPHDGHGHAIALAGSETIGEFYERIGLAFTQLNPEINTDLQVGGPLIETVVTSVQDAVAGAGLIRRQGEGSLASPADTGIDDLSHFYRFEELLKGHQLIYDEQAHLFRDGPEILWPDTWPMKIVPPGGYQSSDVPVEARALIDRFDRLYSEMIDLLQAAWAGKGQAAFLKAIELMFELQVSAKKLMEMPVDAESGTLGPCFRYVG